MTRWQRIKCYFGLGRRRFLGMQVYEVTDGRRKLVGTFATRDPDEALHNAQMNLTMAHFQSGSRDALICNLEAYKKYEYLEL